MLVSLSVPVFIHEGLIHQLDPAVIGPLTHVHLVVQIVRVPEVRAEHVAVVEQRVGVVQNVHEVVAHQKVDALVVHGQVAHIVGPPAVFPEIHVGELRGVRKAVCNGCGGHAALVLDDEIVGVLPRLDQLRHLGGHGIPVPVGLRIGELHAQPVLRRQVPLEHGVVDVVPVQLARSLDQIVRADGGVAGHDAEGFPVIADALQEIRLRFLFRFLGLTVLDDGSGGRGARFLRGSLAAGRSQKKRGQQEADDSDVLFHVFRSFLLRFMIPFRPHAVRRIRNPL